MGHHNPNEPHDRSSCRGCRLRDLIKKELQEPGHPAGSIDIVEGLSILADVAAEFLAHLDRKHAKRWADMVLRMRILWTTAPHVRVQNPEGNA